MSTHTSIRLLLSTVLIACSVWLSSCSSSMSPPAPPPPPVMSAEGGMSNRYASKMAPAAPLAERPGLGTQAGRESYSQLVTTRLIRKSTVPDAVDSFHYNDEKGAKAMVNILGGSTTQHSGSLNAAGDRLKVSLQHYGRTYPHYEASGRRIVIGEAGQSYGIRLENRTKKRLEVVLSVDGINTMSGKTASPSQRGYVLEPKETYEVEGYQKNQNTVRVFQFGRVADSVAATKGGANNVGVIGMAVFEEDEARAKAELQQEQFLRNGASAFPVSR